MGSGIVAPAAHDVVASFWLPAWLPAGHVIAAMYSAAPALERIHQEQEDALVTAYATRDAATATAAVEGTADGEA